MANCFFFANCFHFFVVYFEKQQTTDSALSPKYGRHSRLSDRPSQNLNLSEDTKVVSQASRDSFNNFNHRVQNFENRFKPEINLPSTK